MAGVDFDGISPSIEISQLRGSGLVWRITLAVACYALVHYNSVDAGVIYRDMLAGQYI